MVNRLVSLTEMILLYVLINYENEFHWILINCGFYGNQCNSGLASENACIGDYYQCARFNACIKKVHSLPEISSYAAALFKLKWDHL